MSSPPPRPPERLAYFDCFSGVSGDMTLGALIEVGLDFEELSEILAGLGLTGYTIAANRVTKHHLTGTKVDIRLTSPQPHRTYPDIVSLITAAPLPPPVQELSQAIFRCLAEAEARVHQQAVEQVHFHEVGAVDSILDVVGVAYGFWALDLNQIYASALPLGQGLIRCAHGLLPNPAPATLLLLNGVPVYGTEINAELVTPTGAAILKGASARFGPCPALTVEQVGYGAGTLDLPSQPNLLRLLVGRPTVTPALGHTERVLVMETHIDDLPPELYEHLMAALFAAGALDVAYAPLQMKKNRPGIRLTVIAPLARRGEIIETLFLESTTLGVRLMEVERVVAQRWSDTIDTPYGPLPVKVTEIRGQRRLLPEYEACRQMAQKHHLPLLEVYRLIPSSI
ncbi:MAG: nickel pincer cofactor biosynthesis protein LarC [Deltaproteobacteria bacterium]|nr:nickel pincer cofactor biosynthesis protein LarC [Deltaproteobacteria bacterium]MBW2134221.1 nickel pincer cofactor biosynthesis protein LarC [Deltaproteobacteria bacterium]